MKTTADFVSHEHEAPYTRAEIMEANEQWPERGLLYPHCKMRIPQFQELTEADEQRVRHLALNGRPIMAMQELKAATGCSISWARLWVQHGGKAIPLFGETPPCPYCGQPLRTSLAKQCRFCHRDWHEVGG